MHRRNFIAACLVGGYALLRYGPDIASSHLPRIRDTNPRFNPEPDAPLEDIVSSYSRDVTAFSNSPAHMLYMGHYEDIKPETYVIEHFDFHNTFVNALSISRPAGLVRIEHKDAVQRIMLPPCVEREAYHAPYLEVKDGMFTVRDKAGDLADYLVTHSLRDKVSQGTLQGDAWKAGGMFEIGGARVPIKGIVYLYVSDQRGNRLIVGWNRR